MQLVLQPCADPIAQRNFEKTVRQPVQFDRLKTYVGKELYGHLLSIFPEGRAQFWGVVPGKGNVNEKYFDKIELGATVAFAGFGRIFALGEIAAKFKNPELASHLWDFHKGGTRFENMYALANVRAVGISYADFNSAVRYDPTAVVQNFRVLDEQRSEWFFDHFPQSEIRTDFPYQPSLIKRAITELAETERRVEVLQRVEQSALRQNLLKGRPTGQCLLCGRLMDARFLVAAHIKKRSECTTAERRDILNVAMLNCRFGCDELFERGMFIVEESGKLTKTARMTDPVALRYFAEEMLDQIAIPTNSAKYFEWHRTSHASRVA